MDEKTKRGQSKQILYCPWETRPESDGFCQGRTCSFWSLNLQGCSIPKQAEAMVEIAHYLKEISANIAQMHVYTK